MDGEIEETLDDLALIRRYWPFIDYLAQATREEIGCVMTCLTEGQLRIICGICKNVLSNSLHLSSEQISQLQSHKRVIRFLARPDASKKRKISTLKKAGLPHFPLIAEILASRL